MSAKDRGKIDATTSTLNRSKVAIKRGIDERSEQINNARLVCEDAENILAEYGEAKAAGNVKAWRSAYIAARRKCKDSPTVQCDPREIQELTIMLGELKLMDKYPINHSGGKMVGGGYAEFVARLNALVAQLSALVAWLADPRHATNISECAKWFLQKIWDAAIRVANTTVEYSKAAAEVTGITDMSDLLHLVAELGVAAIDDIHNTLLGDQGTTTFSFAAITFNFAIEAVKFIMGAISNAVNPYKDVFEAYINGVMTANITVIKSAVGGSIAAPDDFGAWLGRTPVATKLYWMLVSLKLAQNAIAAAGIAGAGASMAMRTSIYIAPIVYHVTNSNIFTAALLMHAGFYQLSIDSQNRLITLYHAADEKIADTILPKPDEHKAFTTHLYEVLQQADLDHYKAIVKADQELVQINADIGEIEKKLENTMVKTDLQRQIDVKRSQLLAKKVELDDMINESILSTSSAASSVFTSAAGGQHAGLASKLEAAGAGAGNQMVPGDNPNAGGNRSTRKRGMNKKGGAKSKCSPKSTRKGGRKHSARKRR